MEVLTKKTNFVLLCKTKKQNNSLSLSFTQIHFHFLFGLKIQLSKFIC